MAGTDRFTQVHAGRLAHLQPEAVMLITRELIEEEISAGPGECAPERWLLYRNGYQPLC